MTVDELSRVDFYTSHEGLNLHYEAAQTRKVPRREGHYLLTTHMPWIGERTRALDGAHVEFFRGVAERRRREARSQGRPARRGGAPHRASARRTSRASSWRSRGWARPTWSARCRRSSRRSRRAGRRVLWMCDPMHGNTQSTSSGHQDAELRRHPPRDRALLRDPPGARHRARGHPLRADGRGRDRVRRRRDQRGRSRQELRERLRSAPQLPSGTRDGVSHRELDGETPTLMRCLPASRRRARVLSAALSPSILAGSSANVPDPESAHLPRN